MSVRIPVEQQIAALSAQINQLSIDLKAGVQKFQMSSGTPAEKCPTLQEIGIEFNMLIRKIVAEEEEKIRVIYRNNPDLFEVWIRQHKQTLETLPRILKEISDVRSKIALCNIKQDDKTYYGMIGELTKWTSYKNPYLITTVILFDLIVLLAIFKCI